MGQGFGRFMGYLVYLILGRLYGPAAVGLYGLGIAAVQFANILSQFGMENGVVRWVSHHAARGDTARVRGTVLQVIGISLGLSLVLSAGMFFGAGTAAQFFDDPERVEAAWRAFSVSLPFFTLMTIMLWATQGFQTVTYAAITQQIFRPTLNVLLLVVFYLLGAQVFGAIAAYVISMFVGAVLALYYLRRLFPPLFDRKVRPRYETRALFAVSIPMSVTTLTQYVNSWAPLWVLGLYAPLGPVGIFQLAIRTAALAAVVRFAFGGIFSPIISNFYSRGALDELGRLYKDVSRWIFTGGVAFFGIICLLARDVLVLSGSEFAAGFMALIVMAAAQLFSTSVGPTPRMLAMTNNQNLVMIATVISAVAAVAAGFALIPPFGLMGAAYAAAIAIVVENLGTLLAVRWRLGFWPYGPAYLKPIAAGLGAAGAAYLLGQVLSLPTGLISIAVLTPVFGLGFVALLFLFGLSASDREFLGAFWILTKRYLKRDAGVEGEQA